MVANLDNNWPLRLRSVSNALAMEISGRITAVTGLTVDVADFAAPVGAECLIFTRNHEPIPAQVIGFRDDVSIVMPLAEMTGIACGDRVKCLAANISVPIGPHLLGRVINGNGQPIDGKGDLLCQTRKSVEAKRIQPLQRKRIDTPLSTGIRAIDALNTCGCGQRLGIFSGPGVGKSILLGMIARNTSADVSVIALIGERGREVREFIEKDLGPEGLARSVVVVSTSDEPAPLRVKAGFVAATVAEYFRDLGNNVLMLMDSVTRITMAQRQIGLSCGEPPATKGYTPSVFAMLPQLLERCGSTEIGSITGFFTVLVESDDFTEPISDAMRGILDGHLWLSRKLANRGHYPAVDLLESISRVMVDIVSKEHLQAARELLRLVAVFRDIEDLVNIGAYAPGANPEFDLAINARKPIEQFLIQGIQEKTDIHAATRQLHELIHQINNTTRTLRPVLKKETKQNEKKATPSAADLQRMMVGL